MAHEPETDAARSLRLLANHRDEKLGARGRVLDRVKGTYLRTARDEAFNELLEKCLRSLSTRLAGGERQEGLGIMILGESGAGKSRLIRTNVAKHKLFANFMEPGRGCAAIGVRCRGAFNHRVLAQEIMRASGYPIRSLREADAWDEVRNRLEHLGVLLLYVDEVNDLLASANRPELRRITNNFRALMNDATWPVVLILSGTPECEKYLKRNRALRRRLLPMTLESLTSADLPVVADHIKDLAGKANLRVGRDALRKVVPRLVHAASMQFGTAINITIDAITSALVAEGEDLLPTHFAEAYTLLTQASPEANPFLTEKWSRVVPLPIAETDDDDGWTAAAAAAASSRSRPGLG